MRAKRLAVGDRIRNVGPVSVADGPSLYREANICFVPTIFETSTANYPEAMAMGLPIVTTDLDFAHDSCKDAAVYYRPKDAESAADAILSLLGDRQMWSRCIRVGRERLTQLPTQSEKYAVILGLLKQLSRESELNSPIVSRRLTVA